MAEKLVIFQVLTKGYVKAIEILDTKLPTAVRLIAEFVIDCRTGCLHFIIKPGHIVYPEANIPFSTTL